MASYIYASNLDISDLQIPESAIPGDVINYDEYRDGESYFLGWDGKLINNPDISGAGYLTIPIKVTKHFHNAVKYYEKVMRESEAATIVLKCSDQWVVRKYGRQLPEGWILYYTPINGDKCINIVFDNSEKGVSFNLFDTYEYIKEYYDKMELPQVSYKLSVKTSTKWSLYVQSRDLILPSSWKCDFAGATGGGGFNDTKYKCHGALEDRKAAIAAIKQYYDEYEGDDLQYTLKRSDDK